MPRPLSGQLESTAEMQNRLEPAKLDVKAGSVPSHRAADLALYLFDGLFPACMLTRDGVAAVCQRKEHLDHLPAAARPFSTLSEQSLIGLAVLEVVENGHQVLVIELATGAQCALQSAVAQQFRREFARKGQVVGEEHHREERQRRIAVEHRHGNQTRWRNGNGKRHSVASRGWRREI
jgi:hypothetical protein